jgi:hypothetical protein
MDIENVDPSQDNFDKWLKSMKKSKQKTRQSHNHRKEKPQKRPQRKKKVTEDEAAFHFIAYVPVNGVVWRCDGLQHQPRNLGKSN